jgi:hypothetical protein
MKNILILVFTLLLAVPAFGQFQNQQQQQRGADPLRNRIPNQPPTETQKENRLKEMEDKKQEFITDFISKLEGDAFQKEIIKQTIDAYFTKKIELLTFPFSNLTERTDALKAFDSNHFTELKSLISENDMKRIMNMTEGNLSDEDDDKKKKKRRRKKDNDN